MSQKPKELNFTVSSYLKSVIGQDLITDDFVAVFELVKNSYDAGATRVDVEFTDEGIIIRDDGKGMSYADIKDKWLFVAYSAKSDGTEDQGDLKPYAGSKGVGRFSADRLGQNLTIFTRKAGEDLVSRLDVNWEHFEKSSKKHFVEIPVGYEEIHPKLVPTPLSLGEHGTVLQIKHPRGNGAMRSLLSLRENWQS